MEKKQVVIIGAGASGLAAASALMSNGNFDVTLLEAESRIGGRIHTIDYKGEKIELGAKWIHGKEGNTIYEVLSKHFNSSAFKFIDERYETSQNSYIGFISGKKLTPEALECFHNSRNLLYSIECDIKDKLQSQQVSEYELKYISVKDYATKIWDREYNCHQVEKSQLNAMWRNIMTMMGVVDGAYPDTSSCLLYYYYKEIDVDVELNGSFSVLLDFLIKNIPKSSIKLNSKVESIYWNADTEKLPSNESSSKNISYGIGNGMHHNVDICRRPSQNTETSDDTTRFKSKSTLNGQTDLNAETDVTMAGLMSKSTLNWQPSINESHHERAAKGEVTRYGGLNESDYASSCEKKINTTKFQVAQSSDQNESIIAKSCDGERSATKLEFHNVSQQNGHLAELQNLDKVRVSYTDESGSAKFIDANHVIVTVSLGVLKKYHKELFKPNLPMKKQQCIEMMGFGVVGKLHIHFPKRIWDDSDFALYLLCDSIYDDSDRRSWCGELDLIEIFNGHILIVWLNKIALEKVQDLTKDEIWEHLNDIIKGHCGKTIPTPDDIFVTQWGQNENFLGSYSYTALGETNETRRIACEPLHVKGVPRILFAGEAFHESRFGTVDGAYLTGLREAKRIIQCYEHIE